jgi:hypothetical protein
MAEDKSISSLELKEKVRPLYNALQGYLKEAPSPKDANEILHDTSQWEYVNNRIDRLNATTGRNYDGFKISLDRGGYVRISSFKGKLGGLINYLHAEYFNDEPAPLSGNPSMVINQSQNQTASIVFF